MKAIIIEDELLIATELQASLAVIDPGIRVLAVLQTVQEAVEWFNENEMPDLAFMDIKLGDGLSFEIFDEVAVKCPVIFCTAYEEYAVRAFKVNGVDYLLKPVQEEDLEKAIGKIKASRKANYLESPDIKSLVEFFQSGTVQPTYKQRFIVSSNNKLIPVETKDIAAICREHINYYYKFNGDKLIADYMPLDDLEAMLDPNLFFRANRQTIINIGSVSEVKTFPSQKLMLRLKPPLKIEVEISRDKAPVLKRWMDR